MSMLESTRKMTTNEKMCYDMGYAQGKQDAVPVVRGEWKNVYKSGHKPNPENVCSECDCWSHRRSDYCPNCGARMSKEEAVEKKIGVPDWKPEDEREKIEKMFESFVIDGKKWTVIEDWHWLNETSFIVTAKAQDEDGNVMQASRQADEAEDWSKFKRKADDEQT